MWEDLSLEFTMILQAYLQKWLNLTLDMHVVFPLVYRLIEMALLLRDDIGWKGLLMVCLNWARGMQTNWSWEGQEIISEKGR